MVGIPAGNLNIKDVFHAVMDEWTASIMAEIQKINNGQMIWMSCNNLTGPIKGYVVTKDNDRYSLGLAKMIYDTSQPNGPDMNCFYAVEDIVEVLRQPDLFQFRLRDANLNPDYKGKLLGYFNYGQLYNLFKIVNNINFTRAIDAENDVTVESILPVRQL